MAYDVVSMPIKRLLEVATSYRSLNDVVCCRTFFRPFMGNTIDPKVGFCICFFANEMF